MQLYPQNVTDNNVTDTVQQICRLRLDDITDRNNFPNIFVSGRKVNKIPASSTDVATTDCTGDVNYDSNYFYYLVNVGGTNVWRRIASASW